MHIPLGLKNLRSGIRVDISKNYWFLLSKSCVLGLFLLFANWYSTQAQVFLQYEINGLQKSGYFPDSLSRESFLGKLTDSLQLEGYLNASIESKTFYSDTLAIVMKAGEMHHWILLRKGNLDENLAFRGGYVEKDFQHRPFDFRNLRNLFRNILDEAQNTGFPFAAIRLDSISRQERGLSAAIDFDPGPFITFDTVQITGNSKIKPIFLSRLLRISPGTAFSQKKIDQSIGLVKSLPFLQAVNNPQLSFQNQKAQLHLPINDRRINSIDGVIGILPNENGDNKLLVTGQFALALYNVAGRGRNYQLSWQRLSQYSQNLRVAGEEPQFFGSGIDLKASFYLLKEDTTFLNRDFRIDFGYRTRPDLYMSFFSRRQAGDLLAVSQWVEAEQLPKVADFRYNNYGINLVWNTLDDALWPRQGWLSEAEAGIGNKKILKNTGLPLSVYQGIIWNNMQYYLKLFVEKHIAFSPGLGVLMRLSAGEINNKNLFLNDLFRLGGLKSLRGFNENFFFANRFVYANFEPRYYFDDHSYFLLFMDVGRIQNKVVTGEIEQPLSFGGGISLASSDGVFHFIYALGQSNTQRLGFNFSKIHFGFTGRF